MELNRLEKKISYRFRDRSFLVEACRHSSYVNEHPDRRMRDNERLEFLGDAVLNLVVGHLLMHRYPKMPEGRLSRMRANLVNETQLARIARTIRLGNFLQLGKGEIQTNGRDKNSILADAFEALIAAIYQDGGYGPAFKFVKSRFAELINSISESSGDYYDYKSRFQEVIQVRQGVIPSYRIVAERGPDHDKTFDVLVEADNIRAKGTGKSKKAAEQNAAQKALKQMNIE